jgi:cell wall assembly regulator SMI1
MKSCDSAQETQISSIWCQIQAWLDENWFEETALPPGANEKQIEAIEKTVGLKLPNDLKEFYRLHDGTGKITLMAFDPWRITYPVLSLSGIAAQWKTIQKALKAGAFDSADFANKPNGPIAKVWFHPAWIPVVDNQNGDYLFVDLAPGKGGLRGQVIDFFRHSGATNVLTNSFADLLLTVAKQLRAGEYKADKKSKSLVPAKTR